MVLVSTWTGILIYPFYPSREPNALEVIAVYINRIDILFFIATVTAATLSTTGYWRKDLLFRISVYLFTISMTLFLLSVAKLVLTPPWVR